MAYNFRSGRTLTCFYCGSRSAEKLKGKVRQWKCTTCEAVNHLDEQGQITEPPHSASSLAPVPQTATRYARSISPDNMIESPIFCTTCLKNQHLLTQNLASYLPPEDDPSYAKHLASLGTYRESLEQRYPPVCAACAPKARDRIMRSAKFAQTDHLGRLTRKTKEAALTWRREGRWRGSLFTLAGLGWVGSAGAQAVWHMCSALRLEIGDVTKGADVRDDGDVTLDMDPRESTWIRLLLSNKDQVVSYHELLTRWMPIVLWVAALTFWWNGAMRRKYLGAGGKMSGMSQYYAFSAITLGIRVAAWAILNGPSDLVGIKHNALYGVHCFMALFLLTVATTSPSMVKLVQPKVSFHITKDMILPDVPESASFTETRTPSKHQHQGQHNSLGSVRHQNNLNNFPVGKLGTPQKQQPSHDNNGQQSPYAQIPTPPPDEHYEDPDAMDWTPSTTHVTSFNPRPRNPLTQTNTNNDPSPFYGSLPRAPPARMSAARFPQQPTSELPKTRTANPFRMASWRDQENFHNTLQQRNLRHRGDGNSVIDDDISTTDGGYESDRTTRASDEPRARGRPGDEMQLRPPRFFPASDTVDTGLEVMFDQVFSMRDYGEQTSSGNGGTEKEQRTKTEMPTAFSLPETQANHVEASGSASLGSYVLIASVPALIFAGALAVVKGVR